METVFRRLIKISNRKPIEFGLQMLFGCPRYTDKPETLTKFIKIVSKSKTYYSFWIADIMHFWWEY